MKRQIFFYAAVMILANTAIAANSQVSDDFEKGIVDSVTIDHPILAKVFPGVQFMVVTSTFSAPHVQRIYAYYGGERLVGSFNEIYARVDSISKADIADRIEAFIRLNYWRRDSNLTIVKMEKVRIEKDGIQYSYRMAIRLHYEMPGTTNLELLIQIRKDQIARVEVYEEGLRKSVFKPKIIGFADDATITVGGTFVIQETWTYGDPPAPWNHYYLVSSENGIQTGYAYTFTVSGLEPGQGVNVKVKPILWDPYDYFFFESGPITGPPSGQIIVYWTPGTPPPRSPNCPSSIPQKVALSPKTT